MTALLLMAFSQYNSKVGWAPFPFQNLRTYEAEGGGRIAEGGLFLSLSLFEKHKIHLPNLLHRKSE